MKFVVVPNIVTTTSTLYRLSLEMIRFITSTGVDLATHSDIEYRTVPAILDPLFTFYVNVYITAHSQFDDTHAESDGRGGYSDHSPEDEVVFK